MVCGGLQWFVVVCSGLRYFDGPLRATENKVILQTFVKRCPILLISSKLALLSPLWLFLTGAK